MNTRALRITTVALALLAGGPAAADRPAGEITCADLHWAAEVLASNPDIALACQGVYEKDGLLYARAVIEVVRTQANTLWFRTLRTDGTLGLTRSVRLDANWRVKLDGRDYRLNELESGQRLNIYLPEDRFALTVVESSHAESGQTVPIEN